MCVVDLSHEHRSHEPILKDMRLKTQLRLFIEHRGITAAALARKSGVSKQVLSQWLSGAAPKKIEQVKSVADALETSVDVLAFGHGVEPKSKMGDVSSLFGEEWIGGVFEVRFRRVGK